MEYWPDINPLLLSRDPPSIGEQQERGRTFVEHAVRTIVAELGQTVTGLEWRQTGAGTACPIAVERQGLREIVIQIEQCDIKDIHSKRETRSEVEMIVRRALTRMT